MRNYGYRKPRGAKQTETPKNLTEITAYFDGACWPNPGGHAAAGAVIKRDGMIIAELNDYLGNQKTSNNVAEYSGLLLILNWLIENKIQYVNIFGDSDMVINQMRGLWKCRTDKGPEKSYVPYYRQAVELRQKLPYVKYYWIPRAQNEEADYQSRVPLIKRGLSNPYDKNDRPKTILDQFHDAIDRDDT